MLVAIFGFMCKQIRVVQEFLVVYPLGGVPVNFGI